MIAAGTGTSGADAVIALAYLGSFVFVVWLMFR